eukprot:GFUD01006501.1.p1 GENE.GFUD01006501.1~~GFUD01006501.1.p1  ORF type:complete len:289 (+),score=64.93 GFUD01006501.1:59-925(+)
MCKVDNKVGAEDGDMKQKLEDDILVTEKQLAELRMVTNKETEMDLGKARRLGLEAISCLASVRHNFLICLNFHLSTHQACRLENVAVKSTELGLDLNQSRKVERVEWRSLAQKWMRIVSSIENVIDESCDKETNISAVSTVLSDLVGLESDISLHLECVLSGRFCYSNLTNRQAIRHIQEYEDRLNSAQGNRLYQRHGHRSKSFRVKNVEAVKVNGVNYKRSKTAELPSISKTAEESHLELKPSKSDSSMKISSVKLNTCHKNECQKNQRHRKTSILNQMSNMFKSIL